MTRDTSDTTPETGGHPDAPDGAEDAGGAAATGGAAPAALSVEELEELKKRCDERDAYRSELLRSRADFENFQKRVRKERPQVEDQAARRVLKDLIPVCDNLERALAAAETTADLAALKEGVRLTHELLIQALEAHGVRPIDVSGGFDPELHEAVGMVDPAGGAAPGSIAEVLEKGFRHKDTVLRPTRVIVTRGSPSDTASGEAPPAE